MSLNTLRTTCLSLTGLCASLSLASAQDLNPNLTGSATFAYIGSGETDLGDNDTIESARTVVGARVDWVDTPDLRFGAEFQFGQTSYSFDSAFLGRGDLDVDEFSLSFPVSIAAGERARIFVTPSVTFNGEDGVSFSDGSYFSLIGGIGWQLSPTLFIGPGLGVAESLVDGDGASVFPFLVVDWQFADQWSLTTGSGFAASRGPGLRVAYEPNDKWELSLEARLEEFEFRLDDSNPISNGVGRDNSVPVVFIAQYKPSERVSLSGFAGVSTGGSLEVFNDRGSKVFDEDYDTAPLFGIAASFSF